MLRKLTLVLVVCFISASSDSTDACDTDGSCTGDEEVLVQTKKSADTITQPEVRGVNCDTIDRSGKWCCYWPQTQENGNPLVGKDRCDRCDPNGCDAADKCSGDDQKALDARCNWGNPPAPPQGCDADQPGYNNGGSNINQQFMELPPDQCKQRCAERGDCKGWTYIPDYSNGVTNMCYLKNRVDAMQSDTTPGIISGNCHGSNPPNPPRECQPMQECKNNDGTNIEPPSPTTVYSQHECEKQCKIRGDCKGWTFIPNTLTTSKRNNECYIKSWVNNMRDDKCGIWSGNCH